MAATMNADQRGARRVEGRPQNRPDVARHRPVRAAIPPELLGIHGHIVSLRPDSGLKHEQEMKQHPAARREYPMKLISVLAAATAVAAIASPSAAANISGPRVEAIAGWDKPSFDFGGADADADGVVFGIGAGYDFAVGKTVAIGIDVEATESTAGFDITDGTDRVEFDAGRDLYAGLRLTAAASDKVNLYFKAGYTNARITATLTTPTFAEVLEGEADGGRVGLGAQFAVGSKAYIGAEYRYSNYESDLSRHQALATLGLRF
ncbi:MAG TPA: porin family protein [Allosphingosinicella sp.]